MPQPEPLRHYLEWASGRSLEDFSARLAEPVLVLETSEALSRTGELTLVGPAPPPTGPRVARIRKRPGARSLASMVTLGRSQTNDIEIKAGDISKHHAYFHFASDGRVLLVDAGSSNGTRVEGRLLRPRAERAPLESGARVSFGNQEGLFLLPKSFYYYLLRHDPTPVGGAR